MKVEKTETIIKLWLSADDTKRWANRFGSRWPCSVLSGHSLFAEFDGGDLVDITVDGGSTAIEILADEFNAITADFLSGKMG